jgi:hypothetical protein
LAWTTRICAALLLGGAKFRPNQLFLRASDADIHAAKRFSLAVEVHARLTWQNPYNVVTVPVLGRSPIIELRRTRHLAFV